MHSLDFRSCRPPGHGISLLCLAVATVAGAADAPRVLTLEETISLALRQNISLQRSAVQVEVQDNAVRAAKGARQPDLTVSAGATESAEGVPPRGIFDEGGAVFSESLSASLSSSVTLVDGGQIDAAIEAARDELKAARNDYDRDRQGLLFDAVSAHLNVVLLGRQVVIREEELANRREELDRIRINRENGLRVASEVLRQQALVAEAERGLIEARRQQSVAVLNLQNLLRLPIGEPAECADPTERWGPVEELPQPDLSASLASLNNRLDLEAQRARLDSARQSVRNARAGKHAVLSASARLSTGYSDGGGGSFSNQWIDTRPNASASLSLSIPIFDRRRTETNVRRSRLNLRQEELYLDGLELNARTALHQALLDYRSAQAQLAASLDQLASAEAALEAEEARYEAGVATLPDVNSLRSTRLEAAVAVEQARFDLFTSRLSVSYEDGSIESFLLERLPSLEANLF